MRELIAAIPDSNALLELEPEELGAKMLFLLRARREEKFHPGSLLNEMWIDRYGHPTYSGDQQPEISLP